ncbi:class I SAM-dependent methyltransferase [Gloeocapsa sp. PCC 73106]|uniref:class I SAM-dependent methyltransferase n=1 Tax=Gloeocapsa sp. PCC 73106 TaxID=102232 RepID=UPI0002ABD7C6|nr:class I SAM-dependent methyltransferase [Gloeocapsa sp. PCC 73106]ELR97726.1 methylase involved in ubiquinone/menaquinone biosynthesis [Gloeocapsa sp. PCC 73106]
MQTKLKPDWAGQDWLSRLVNLLISTKPLYAVMKYQARQVIIKTAEKKGIPWRESCQALQAEGVETKLSSLTNPDVVYPDYYQVPFHAYSQGNLCWQAALEAPAATYAMALRVWKDEDLTWEEAQKKLRANFYQVLGQYSPEVVTDVLDLGCSVGISTLSLHRYYQQQQVRTVGLDLSPYMLAVAQTLDKEGQISKWCHSQAEKTDFADNSFDVITLQFVLHELPNTATEAIFREALRILKPGGCLGIIDNNPRSPVIQNLPPALFLLMKSTEPWSDEYYTFDVVGTLEKVGFKHQSTQSVDPRHRAIIATK